MFHLQSFLPIFILRMWNSFGHSLTFVNYKLLILFQQVDVYLSEPIKIDEQIKIANSQSINLKARS